MQPSEAILVVLLVALIAAFAFQRQWGACGCAKCKEKGSFLASAPDLSPYTPIGFQDAAIRGARHDAFNQEHAFRSADLAKNYRAWAASPRDLEEAQRAAWFESTASGDNAFYNAEAGGDAAAELTQHHTPAPSINYQDALVDLVADPRMRAQQANWHSEVAPKSQTAMRVDTLDEAAAIAHNRGHGLYAFRFPAVSQHNPLFITDQDAESYGVHTTRFSFGG